ncbi:MAG: lysostaphin resistance A-like protein [Gammaproteobacteria bacterium]
MPPADSAAAPALRLLNGRHALALVAGYVIAQILGGILVGMGWGFRQGFEAALHGGKAAVGVKPGIDVLAWSVLAGLVVAGIWAVYFGRHYAHTLLRDPGPGGVAWRPAVWRAYGVAVLLAILLLLLAILVERLDPPELSRLTGPAEQLARAHGLPYVLFVICVVFIAPPLEEFVFRGVAFAAVARSFGMLAAVVLTTLAFMLLHYADNVHYWPGFLLVGALGLAAAGLRLRFKSLWPGIVMHCGYNALLLFFH